jgi:hypothetical protein
MSDIMGTISGFLVSILKPAFHILLLLLHNAIFIAIAAALLYVMFRLVQSGVRRLSGRGAAPPQETETRQSPTEAAPGKRAAGHRESHLERSTLKDQSETAAARPHAAPDETSPTPQGGPSIPQQSEPGHEQGDRQG